MIVLLLIANGVTAQGRVPGLAKVLMVAEVDKTNGRVLFETSGVETRNIKRDGKVVPTTVMVRVKVAFCLKEGKAITAEGKAVKETDLWKNGPLEEDRAGQAGGAPVPRGAGYRRGTGRIDPGVVEKTTPFCSSARPSGYPRNKRAQRSRSTVATKGRGVVR